MMRASGCSRRARRIAWRACRSASAVTAQVLTMAACPSAAPSARRRITSLSAALRRQPKVMISTPSIGSAGEQRGIDAALEGERCRTCHDHMAVLAPAYVERAAIERDGGAPAGQTAAMAGDQCGAGAGAAGAGNADAALPDAQPDPVMVEHGRDADIGAIRKQRVVFEQRAERGEADRLGVGNKEGRVRVA